MNNIFKDVNTIHLISIFIALGGDNFCWEIVLSLGQLVEYQVTSDKTNKSSQIVKKSLQQGLG